MAKFILSVGDCLEVLKNIEINYFSSIICDPPYGIKFRGNKWDYNVPSVLIWQECFRVLKPGGFLLSFSSARTYHRMVVNIEDAGFEIRDMIAWLYSSGMPKSLDIAKSMRKFGVPDRMGAIELASHWEGWGTSLKPAIEPITVARKPLNGSVVENVLSHETGGLNVGSCRIGDEKIMINTFDDGMKPFGNGAGHPYTTRYQNGRWPANVIHDGSDDVLSCFPIDGGKNAGMRFFYCAKANKNERNLGLVGKENNHPTVKPISLMRYLCRLVTSKGGIICDPFMGSGTTGIGSILEGFDFHGIDFDVSYVDIASCRLSYWSSRKE